MAGGAIRTLYTDLKLRASEAVKGLKAYDKLWTSVAKTVDTAATSIERSADRASSALARIAEGAANVRASVPKGAGAAVPRASSARPSKRPAADPLDAILLSAQRSAKASAAVDKYSKALTNARDALGKTATAEDRARATSRDLTETVTRNREALARLRTEALRTGDADGELAREQRALSVATAGLVQDLGRAKREVAEYDKAARAASDGRLAKSFTWAKVAAGNLASSAVQSVGHGIVNALGGATKSAIDFESEMANVAKVVDGLKTPTGAITAEYTAMESKVLELSKTIAGPGAAGFAKIYAAAGEAGIAKEDLNQFAESAAKVSVAFGVTAEEAGSGMAKMRSGLGLSQDGVESLAGTMNLLSNNMAVTAAQAMEVVLKTGGVGKAANVSGQEVAGLGAAMIAAGAQSDVAATASKNYILSLAAGTTATKSQRAAFKSLGMDAEEVAKQFTGSAQQRLKVQQDLLTEIGKLSEDQRVSVLSNLFGKESLGAISGITGDVDKFTAAMKMATDQTAAASSVQDEYNVRSKTTENAVALLRANIEALAIKFGQALLPYINKIVEFLTSKEGQDWGAKAVEKAVTFVTSFADGLGVVVSVISSMVDSLGGAGAALGALGIAAMATLGPFGMAAAAGVAIGAAMVESYRLAKNAILGIDAEAGPKMRALLKLADDIRHKEHTEDMKGQRAEADAQADEATRSLAADEKIAELQSRFEANERAKKKGKLTAEEEVALSRKSQAFRNAALGNSRLLGGGMQEDRIAAFEAIVNEGDGRIGGGGKQARFDALSAKVRRGEKLRPSEATEYTKLSKSLDEAKASKAPRGRSHKATKMDKQLAAMSPELRGLLVQGGDEDAGGDRKVAGNALDRAVFGAATGGKPGRGGIDGMSSPGPGPNIHNDHTQITTTITMPIDARSTSPIPDNIRNAANEGGVRLGAIMVTGGEKIAAARNGGGVMRGPG